MTESPMSLAAGVADERTLRALLEASAAINGTLDYATVLQAIAQSAAEVLDAEASSVILHDKSRKRMVFKAVVGPLSSSLLGDEFDEKLGIAGRVLETGQAVLVPDVQEHPDFFGGIDEKSAYTTRGMIVAPLRCRGQILGVVEVLNRRDGRPFTERDVDILQVFANLAATGAHNAQLHEDLKRENLGLREVSYHEDTIIGKSAGLAAVMEMCNRVAPTNATTLLLGETGTGKELTARRIHSASPRASKAFIAINCAALPETLLESELFGHEAGAFTGAVQRKLGRFELADGGTLFLDEIGDISLSTQIKLLRVLQEREFVRVGGTKTISCDVRIIAATNRDLKRAMQEGKFRDDLFYRLNVFPIVLPPLRERRDDIPLLVGYFIERHSRELGWARPEVTPAAMELMCSYAWPGNIREMRNVIERAVLLCDDGRVTPEILPREIIGEQTVETEAGNQLEAAEQATIVRALEETDWNQTRAAQVLGISRDNLRYRMRKYDIRRPGEPD